MDKKTSIKTNEVKFVDEKLKNANNDILEKQALLNILYYANKQWIAFDTVNKRLYEPEMADGQVRFTGNRIQPIIRTELSKLTKNKPTCYVIPCTSEESDIKAAKTGEKVLEYLWNKLNLQEVNHELAMWALTTGTGFVKPYWNPNKGDKLIDPNTGETVMTGEVDIEVHSIFDVKLDPTAKKWSEVKWFCLQKLRTVEYVKDVYGVEVEPEKGILESNMFDSQLKDLQNMASVEQKSTENCVIVKEFWEKPSSDYPNGRRITVANGKLLLTIDDIGFGAEDKTERVLPLFHMVHIRVPGRVWGMSVVESLIPIQREYNKTRSQIIENNNKIANPPLLVEYGSLSPNQEEILGVPGEIIEYNNGFNPPKYADVQPISSDVYRNLEQCVEEFYFVSGQNETSQGNVPTSVTSGSAISYLQEQSDAKMAATVENYEKCIERFSAYMLKIVQIKYDRPRMITISGKNRSLEAVNFQGADLTSNDVRVQAGSSIPSSKPAKQQYVLDMVRYKVLDPEKDSEMIRKMLDLGNTDEMYDDLAIDVNQATAEQEGWKSGKLEQVVRDFFNHQTHIEEHNKFRKSTEYAEMPPEVQQIIDAHVNQHSAYMNPVYGSLSPDEQAVMASKTPQEQMAMGEDIMQAKIQATALESPNINGSTGAETPTAPIA